MFSGKQPGKMAGDIVEDSVHEGRVGGGDRDEGRTVGPRYATRIEVLDRTLTALGKRLEITVCDILAVAN